LILSATVPFHSGGGLNVSSRSERCYLRSACAIFKKEIREKLTVPISGRKKLLVALGALIITVLLSLLVPQSVVMIYFLIIFIVIIYAFVKIIQTLVSPSEREKLRKEIWGEQ
jgi:phosphatidylglycerophosphate synthase